MADVVLERVTKTFDKNVVAVNDLSLRVSDGEFIVLVGPSGCGKTTTLRIIAGLEDPTSGSIKIGGRVVNDVPPKNRDIAMVFQNYALYPHMSVYDNMAFGLKLRGFPKAEIKSRVHETAELLGLTDLLSRKPRALSGGQRQRVALGRAIVRKPTVFLFDEPLSNLDARLRVQMRAEIKKLHAQLKTTMVYVTHDQVEAMTMGDRIVVMDSGSIHQVDEPLNIYHHPADVFVAGFIGSPAMNFLTVNIPVDDPLHAEAGNLRLTLPGAAQSILERYRGGNLVAGIRPEHLSFYPDGMTEPAALELRHEMSELLGEETVYYFTTGDTSVLCKSPVFRKLSLGEQATLYYDATKLHFFDPEKGKAIGI